MPPRQPRLRPPSATAGRPARTTGPCRLQGARGACAAAAALLCATGAHAQTATGLVVTPTLSLQQTVTDNRDLSSSDRQADAITQVSPGLRISSRSGQLTGGLTLSLNALHYARASDRNTVSLQTALDSAFHYEALDGRFFADASATASQQAVSAFGVQAPGPGVHDNRSQVTTLSVSPGYRSRIGDFATLEARLNGSKTDTADTSLGDTSAYGAQVSLSGGGMVGWGLNASESRSSFKLGRTTSTQQLGASLSWTPRYDLNFSVRAGRARSDAVAVDPIWVQTSGWSAAWQPTERTDISVQGDRAYFGRSHAVTLRHRMARTVWTYTDTKGVSGDANAQLSVAPLTVYDLFFSICMRSLNDAATCDAQVRLALAQQGLDPTFVVNGGFLASGLTLQRSQNLAVSWSLLRQTVTVSAFRTETRLLDNSSPASGDLALGVPVSQHGATVSVSHRLTEVSSLALSASVQTTPDAGGQAGNELRIATLSWVGTLGSRTSYSLAARRAEFDSPNRPYRESALIGTLNFSY